MATTFMRSALVYPQPPHPHFPSAAHTAHALPVKSSSVTLSAHHSASSSSSSSRSHAHASASASSSTRSAPFVGRLTKDHFIQFLADSLDRSALQNTPLVPLPYNRPESVFFSVSKPDISTKHYIRRLVTCTQCSPSAFVLMIIYVDAIGLKNPNLRITDYNMHRLLVTALMLACKTLDDRCFSNLHYAKVGGIPDIAEMNRLEIQFLMNVHFKLFVSLCQYHAKVSAIENVVLGRLQNHLFNSHHSLSHPYYSPLSTLTHSPHSIQHHHSFHQSSPHVAHLHPPIHHLRSVIDPLTNTSATAPPPANPPVPSLPPVTRSSHTRSRSRSSAAAAPASQPHHPHLSHSHSHSHSHSQHYRHHRIPPISRMQSDVRMPPMSHRPTQPLLYSHYSHR